MAKMIKGLAIYALAYFVLLELMLVAAVLYWPQFEENFAGLSKIMSWIPSLGDMMSVIGVSMDHDKGFEVYAVSQQFFKGCNTLGTAAAVLFAAGAIAGEAHRGTLEIWLARPYSRWRLLTERWVGGAIALGVPIFLTSATIPWLAGFVDEEAELGGMLLCSVLAWAFLLTIYGLTFLLSTLGSHPIRIAVLVLFLAVFEFAIYMVKVVTHYSYFRLVEIGDFARVIDEGRLDWRVLGPLLAIVVALYAASLFAFRRRVP